MSDDEGDFERMEYQDEEFVETYEGGRVGYEAPLKIKDPTAIASYNLYRTLEKYPDFTKEARTAIQNEFINFPDLPILHLETLASVINFLRDIPNPTPNDFKDENIMPYFTRLIPDKPTTAEEKKRLMIRLKAEFLTYIIAVKAFRSEE